MTSYRQGAPDSSRTKQRELALNAPIYLGWGLLAISLVVGWAGVYRGAFVDEADNLATGALLTRGYQLYRDIFAHHFPFAYYWSAAVQTLFGPSLQAARMSVVVFQIASFALAMRLTGYILTLGLTSLIWNVVGYMQLGNLLLYNVFCGVSCVVIFALVLAILSGKRLPDWRMALAIGAYSAVAILSDPLSLYAIMIALLALALSRGGLRYAGLAVGLIAGALAAYAGYLLVSGTYRNFVNDVLVFNTDIYSKYIRTSPVRFRDFFDLSIRGLRIVDFPRENPNPLWPLPPPSAGTAFDGWLFTGFLYRLAILLGVLTFALQRRFSAALFLYFGTAALLVISQRGFHAHSFTLVGILTAVGLVTGDWMNRHGRDHLSRKIVSVSTRVLIGCMAAWLVFRVAAYTIEHRQQFTYESNFAALKAEAEQIKTTLSCNVPGVALGYYPGNPIMYWFTGMKPVSRYTFMWPWVAEVGLSDVLSSLGAGPALVRVDDIKVWGHQTRDYLRALQTYLDRHYVAAGGGWYMSPELAAQCHP